MALTSDLAFDRGLDVFGAVVHSLGPDDWSRPSPCEGWSALDVLGHLGSSIQMGISVLRGEQPTWPEPGTPPADLVDDDPLPFWDATALLARQALVGADLDQVMDTPMGLRSVADRLAFPAIDLYVHAWDVARAAGTTVEIPDDVIDFAHGYIDPMPAAAVRGPGGAFGPEVEVGPDATATERFVAWTGRDPRA